MDENKNLNNNPPEQETYEPKPRSRRPASRRPLRLRTPQERTSLPPRRKSPPVSRETPVLLPAGPIPPIPINMSPGTAATKRIRAALGSRAAIRGKSARKLAAGCQSRRESAAGRVSGSAASAVRHPVRLLQHRAGPAAAAPHPVSGHRPLCRAQRFLSVGFRQI
jgi:hypothetical protein